MVVQSEEFVDHYGTGSRDDRRVLIAEAGAALRSVASSEPAGAAPRAQGIRA